MTMTLENVGNKAAGLMLLATHGYAVPAFTVVTTDQCARILEQAQLPIDAHLAGLDADAHDSLRDTARSIRELIIGLSIPGDIAHEIATQIAVFGSGARLAVRSSVEGEDSAADSFAGQLDTFLDVAPHDVESAILGVLASAYSERSLFYRARRGIDNVTVDAAVIVQVLVDSAVAGVAFSCNPTNGDTCEAVVSAGLGLGEGVVSGTADCDTYFVDTQSYTVNTRVEQIENGPALTDERVAELVTIAVNLASTLGIPQDIEWAIDNDGKLWLLQARPVTVTGMRQTIFDNVNVAESYPGLSTPLTFSVVRLAYEQVFRACHRDFGASRKTVRDNSASLYPYLVGTAHGRIYYNISNWYSLFLQIPGMEFAIEGWEAALGIESRYKRPAMPLRGLALAKMWILRVRVVLVILAGWVRLRSRLASFFGLLNDFTADLDHRLAQENSENRREPHELLSWLERCISELVPAYSAQIFNDFLAQQLFHIIGRIIEKAGVANPEAVRNELFCGEEGVRSVDPVRSLLELANLARSDASLTKLFTSDLDAEQVWAELPQFSQFHSACLLHIAEYGDRTVNELKLETDPLGWRPADLVPLLRNYIRGGQNIADMESHEQQIRRSAEQAMRRALRGKPVLRVAYSFVLRHARENVKQRENMRLGRSRCFGLVKRVFRQYGNHLHTARLIDTPRDIFYLTYEEIAAITRGTFVDGDPHILIAARKADHDRWRSDTPPSRIVTSGMAAAHVSEHEYDTLDDAPVLIGIGCSPGNVEAPVMLVQDPGEAGNIDGQVLVASTTDPGWVFLMVAAGGLVTEKGSLLSHTAIIGRELGITTVVGVKGATRLLHDGDVVAVNGRAGTVTIRRRAA
ncbi:PEP/pyruvate-binding domain-containing protein [Mycobacteroides stephanolepidis]|nr:PEP/pyruvate-binding domain-containing protein [[Mycobacterium] stephanolepidis]